MNKLALTALLLLPCMVTQAGRPLIVDDAEVAENCQIESFWQYQDSESSLSVQPACKVAEIEWALGLTRYLSSEDNVYSLAAKKVWRELSSDSVGISSQLSHEFSQLGPLHGDTQLNFALTKSLAAEQALVHINLGYIRREAQANDISAGIAGQWAFTPEHWLFAEIYREEAGKPFYQSGYIWQWPQQDLQLDISYGNQFGAGQQEHFSAGLVLAF